MGRRNAFPPRARPVYMQGRAQSARIPPSYKGPAMRPSSPPPDPTCVRNVKMTPKAK